MTCSSIWKVSWTRLSGFFFPTIKRQAMVRNLRAMILRSRLTDQQARTIRGMIVAFGEVTSIGEGVRFRSYIIFALVALAAAAFVAWFRYGARPGSKKARALLAGAVALFVLGIGAGVYHPGRPAAPGVARRPGHRQPRSPNGLQFPC